MICTALFLMVETVVVVISYCYKYHTIFSTVHGLVNMNLMCLYFQLVKVGLDRRYIINVSYAIAWRVLITLVKKDIKDIYLLNARWCRVRLYDGVCNCISCLQGFTVSPNEGFCSSMYELNAYKTSVFQMPMI